MWRCLLSLVVLLGLCLKPAAGRQVIPGPPQPIGGTVAPPAENPNERPPPPLPWALAFLFTVGILVIVCMPSRKS